VAQNTANAKMKSAQTIFGRELDAFWREVVNHYGVWQKFDL